MLARQFLVLGCAKSKEKDGVAVKDDVTIDDVKREWNHLLEIAYENLPGAHKFTPIDRTCGGFVSGIFSGKSFVELRNRYGFDGRPAEETAPELATLGQVLGASLGAHLNREAEPGSRPLLQLFRTYDSEHPRLRARRMWIRFHTTAAQVLDEMSIVEGDELYAGSISETIR